MSLVAIIRNIQILRSLAMRLRLLMAKWIPVIGEGNSIKRNGISIHSTIRIRGNNNTVILHKGSVLQKAKIEIYGDNHNIKISSGAYLEGTHIVIEDHKCTLTIGENTFIGPSHIAVTEDGSMIIIGDECMVSSNVQIRTGDSHAIYNSEGYRINHAANVNIGNMVWLGEGCKILKGVSLGDNVIVSTGAIVTKAFACNVLIGGIPAKILKQNVRWSHSRINNCK